MNTPTSPHAVLDLLCRRALAELSPGPAADAEDPALRRATLRALDGELAALEADGAPSPFDDLADRYALDADERRILLLLTVWALAPEAAAALRGGPSPAADLAVGEALALLGASLPARLALRARLAPGARLASRGLIATTPAPDGLQALDRWTVRAAPHVLLHLAGEPGLPAWASELASLRPTDSVPPLVLAPALAAALARAAAQLAADLAANRPAGPLVVVGPGGVGKTATLQQLAAALGRPLLRVEGPVLAARFGPGALPEAARALRHLADFHGAIEVWDDADALAAPDAPHRHVFAALLAGPDAPLAFALSQDEHVAPAVAARATLALHLSPPRSLERAALWRRGLAGAALADLATALDGHAVEVLARKYRFTPRQVTQAIALARPGLTASLPADRALALLEDSARALLPPELERLSVPVPGDLTLADLVLPDEESNTLASLVSACRQRLWVLEAWGFGRRLGRGQGVVALFDGEPGTGKTLSAGILARELGVAAYRVNVAQLVDKYVGETEKNIERIFKAAQAVGALLLFDEADALFSQRVAVGSSQDRFANLQVNTLLQEVEEYDGISILTTNLGRSIDPAFRRRIHFHVHFPFPGPDERAALWERLIPAQAPVEGPIDFGDLGERFEIAGGHIRNALLRAAYAAREAGRGLRSEDLEAAASEECRAAGKLFRAARRDRD